jgi:acyl-CoA synthetase (AMP-forming)/AMP-acid ligase II
MQPVPQDGETMGEIMFKGNIAMKGYLKNPAATAEAFAGGWFHSGDLACMYPDGYIKIKDRSKDIIISGGENISSIEVEDVLYRHPDVLAAAVVAKPDAEAGAKPPAPSSNSKPAPPPPRRHRGALQEAPGRLQGAARRGVWRTAQDQHRARSRSSSCASRRGRPGPLFFANRADLLQARLWCNFGASSSHAALRACAACRSLCW